MPKMYTSQVRETPETIEARSATLPELLSVEPSHIHIPRPSRVGRAINRRLDDGEPIAAQLALEAAAA
jgi:hypothetical protein